MTWKEGSTAVLNTYKDAGFIPLLPQNETKWVFLLDFLELAMSKEQLERITKSWNSGMGLEVIAENEKRDPLEVLMALIHQARYKKIKRPFAFRRD